MDIIKVVVRYANGQVIKGYTSDFFPNKPMFHVSSEPGQGGAEVRVNELKAVFFVKDFVGNSTYQESKFFAEGQRPQGRKVEVTFRDREVLVGTTLGYDPTRSGYFLSPSDDKSNNLRVFVVAAAVERFRFI